QESMPQNSQDPTPACAPVLKDAVTQHIGIIQDGDHTIYTSQIQLKSGEVAYLGFEPVTNDRRKKWDHYVGLTKQYTDKSRGIFSILFSEDADFQDAQSYLLSKMFAGQETDLYKEILSVANAEYKRENSGDKDCRRQKMYKSLLGISSGCEGVTVSGTDAYIGYVSKVPVTGFFPLPENPPVYLDLNGYADAYDSLIMMISSFGNDSSNPTQFEHRGIFRNPMSMLRRDYGGISLILHGFCASARSLAYPESSIMSVNPDGNVKMRNILIDRFPGNQKKGSHFYIPLEQLQGAFLECCKAHSPMVD
ncbi:MAG: hypothetical protein Q8K36_03735, partial [Alphaproteobacteria bacterium]|nr:hypothetical protein [Alphaproteobacteria bacterium]